MTITLTTFIPGTKAKADEVNANFSALQDAINSKAAIDGDSTQAFSVANATADSHAVNKSQLTELSNTLNAQMAKSTTRFCAKSGYTTNGEADLFSYSALSVTPKIGSGFANLIIADCDGLQTTISSAASISMSGKADGEYNIFIKPNGTLYVLNNKIYIQKARPSMLDGDIWLNLSTEPITCVKYDGTSDIKFTDVPLGKVTIKSAAITSLKTLSFNQNGYNITTQTTLEKGTKLAASIPNLTMPDYINGVSKSLSTVYKADSDGYLHFQSRFSGTLYVSWGNADTDSNYSWKPLLVNAFGDQGFTTTTMFPIPKNMYYKASAYADGSCLSFYPCLSV